MQSVLGTIRYRRAKKILGDARAERAWHLRVKRTTGKGKGGDASGKELPICGDGGDVLRLSKKPRQVTLHLAQRYTERDQAEVWGIDGSGVSKASARLEKEMTSDKKLSNRMIQIKSNSYS